MDRLVTDSLPGRLDVQTIFVGSYARARGVPVICWLVDRTGCVSRLPIRKEITGYSASLPFPIPPFLSLEIFFDPDVLMEM